MAMKNRELSLLIRRLEKLENANARIRGGVSKPGVARGEGDIVIATVVTQPIEKSRVVVVFFNEEEGEEDTEGGVPSVRYLTDEEDITDKKLFGVSAHAAGVGDKLIIQLQGVAIIETFAGDDEAFRIRPGNIVVVEGHFGQVTKSDLEKVEVDDQTGEDPPSDDEEFNFNLGKNIGVALESLTEQDFAVRVLLTRGLGAGGGVLDVFITVTAESGGKIDIQKVDLLGNPVGDVETVDVLPGQVEGGFLPVNNATIEEGLYIGDGALLRDVVIGSNPVWVRIWEDQVADGQAVKIFEATKNNKTAGGKILMFQTDVAGVTAFEDRIITMGSLPPGFTTSGFSVSDDGADEHPNKTGTRYRFIALIGA